MDIVTKLEMISRTLNGVSVSGRDNWDRLLACVQAVDSLVQELSRSESSATEKEVEVDG